VKFEEELGHCTLTPEEEYVLAGNKNVPTNLSFLQETAQPQSSQAKNIVPAVEVTVQDPTPPV
jgi:hypothetical protein